MHEVNLQAMIHLILSIKLVFSYITVKMISICNFAIPNYHFADLRFKLISSFLFCFENFDHLSVRKFLQPNNWVTTCRKLGARNVFLNGNRKWQGGFLPIYNFRGPKNYKNKIYQNGIPRVNRNSYLEKCYLNYAGIRPRWQ